MNKVCHLSFSNLKANKKNLSNRLIAVLNLHRWFRLIWFRSARQRASPLHSKIAWTGAAIRIELRRLVDLFANNATRRTPSACVDTFESTLESMLESRLIEAIATAPKESMIGKEKFHRKAFTNGIHCTDLWWKVDYKLRFPIGSLSYCLSTGPQIGSHGRFDLLH